MLGGEQGGGDLVAVPLRSLSPPEALASAAERLPLPGTFGGHHAQADIIHPITAPQGVPHRSSFRAATAVRTHASGLMPQAVASVTKRGCHDVGSVPS
jgi:hypothetical protein